MWTIVTVLFCASPSSPHLHILGMNFITTHGVLCPGQGGPCDEPPPLLGLRGKTASEHHSHRLDLLYLNKTGGGSVFIFIVDTIT